MTKWIYKYKNWDILWTMEKFPLEFNDDDDGIEEEYRESKKRRTNETNRSL